ncbi:threonine dehydratase biosynthetic [Cucumis melo var. makuwa]|uniref:Threonine dehydratase biosynthetic n=1 Tax=Cucumis melo var. makuwa TaxID=1194695 RepID=A0A5A7SLH6_CUCMM|nr:threonine dehydratase biosynthetic [Cucumis melo var. makuwa]
MSSQMTIVLRSNLLKVMLFHSNQMIHKVEIPAKKPFLLKGSANSSNNNNTKTNAVVDGSIASVTGVPEVSWKDLQYPAGMLGAIPKRPEVIDERRQMKYLKNILSSKVYDVAIESPLELTRKLSTQLGINLWLKRDDSQYVFSFKIRGAYNMMANLPKEALESGVICASAGNHAQGVALAAGRLRTEAVIVMPRSTPPIKIDAVRSLGGNVVLHGDTFDDAQEYAQQLRKVRNLTIIPPFDNENVIIGQGTVGMEIGRQMRDGVAVKQVGDENFRISRELIDGIVLVDKDAIAAGIKDMFEDTRSILEPAGAVSIAGAKAYCKYNNIKGVNIVAVRSGANMNFDQLGSIADNADSGNQTEATFATILPEKPRRLKNIF